MSWCPWVIVSPFNLFLSQSPARHTVGGSCPLGTLTQCKATTLLVTGRTPAEAEGADSSLTYCVPVSESSLGQSWKTRGRRRLQESPPGAQGATRPVPQSSGTQSPRQSPGVMRGPRSQRVPCGWESRSSTPEGNTNTDVPGTRGLDMAELPLSHGSGS